MKKALILVGILAVVVSFGLAGCGCDSAKVQKDTAKSMISDAKAAGAASDAKLKSAESSMAAAEKAEKKMKCKDAKSGYEKAYTDAKDAWKSALSSKPAANCPCK